MKDTTEAKCNWGHRAAAVVILILAVALPVAAGKRQAEIRVESNPPGALVSVHPTSDTQLGGAMVVAGETPLTKTFRFPKKQNLWLRLEKPGFEPQVVEIELGATHVTVDLAKLDQGFAEPEPIAIVAVVTPDLTVVRRGFAKEREDAAAGRAAAGMIARALASRLEGRVAIVAVDDADQAELLRPLWRDARSHMELVDPIRLPYMPVPPVLESRSARTAALALAERTGADAVLFVAGRSNVETGGMKAGKVGIMAAGTACSFGSGYANAMSSGSDFFTYNIYLPSFAEGLGLEAVLIDTRTGAVRWANKGLWKPIPLDQPEVADEVAHDLLSGVEKQLSTVKALEIQEEE